MNHQKFQLFVQPSFFEGMARIVDFGSFLNEYNTSKNSDEADWRALLSDWEAVGKDIFNSTKIFEKEHAFK